MSFFENITGLEVFGLILLAVGALVTFLSDKIAAGLKLKKKNSPIIVKVVGLAMVLAAFLIILGVIS